MKWGSMARDRVRGLFPSGLVLAGAVLALVSLANILFILLADFFAVRERPYFGIFGYFILPGLLLLSLLVFAAALFWERRRRRLEGEQPYPILDLNRPSHRGLLAALVGGQQRAGRPHRRHAPVPHDQRVHRARVRSLFVDLVAELEHGRLVRDRHVRTEHVLGPQARDRGIAQEQEWSEERSLDWHLLEQGGHSGVQSLVRDLIPVLDNLDRALRTSEGTDDPLRQGVVLIQQQILDIVKKEGLRPLESLGAAFDPRLHEAVEQASGLKTREDASQAVRALRMVRSGVVVQKNIVIEEADTRHDPTRMISLIEKAGHAE